MAKPNETERDPDQVAIDKAVTPAPAPERSPGELEAERAELDRQKAIEDAVKAAHEDELPKLGGSLLEPGLGR